MRKAALPNNTTGSPSPMAVNLPPVAVDSNTPLQLWNLGYRRLCPVIPPGAPVSPESRIYKRMQRSPLDDPRGKAPGVLGPDGLWRGFDFVKHESTEMDCARWARMGASTGIKLGRGLVAVDIDTTDRDTSLAICELAFSLLGKTAVRFGRRPKALLVYRITADIPYEKVIFSTPTEERALVEILGEGRQFVASGIHPGTMEPYSWGKGDPLPPSIEKLPLLEPVQLHAFTAAVAERMPQARRLIAGDNSARSDVPQERLRGDPALVRDAMRHLPNRQDAFPTRDDYLRMGYALKAAMGPDLEDEALGLYLQWCGRWDAGSNDPEIAEEDWGRMHPPYAVGASWLYEKAEQLGGWRGRTLALYGDKIDEGAPASEPPAEDVYELLDVDDILNMPDPRWLIDRHIPEHGVGLLYGEPSGGKSFIALDWALHVASGLQDWQGDAVEAPVDAHVLYVAGEGAPGYKKRLRAWQTYHEAPRRPNFRLLQQQVNFMRPEDVQKLMRTVRQAAVRPLSLLVVDTVSTVIPGADENLQAEISLFMHACRALSVAFSCPVLGVHHTGKNGNIRGSSVFKANADFVFRLDRDPKNRTGTLTCEKHRDAEANWEELIKFVDAPYPGGSSWIVSKVSAEERAAITIDAERKLLRELDAAWNAGKPWSPSLNAKHKAPRLASLVTGESAEACKAVIDALEAEGKIRVERLDRKTSGYRLVIPDIFD